MDVCLTGDVTRTGFSKLAADAPQLMPTGDRSFVGPAQLEIPGGDDVLKTACRLCHLKNGVYVALRAGDPSWR